MLLRAGPQPSLGTLRPQGTAREIADAHQVVSRSREGEHPTDAFQPAMSQLASQPDAFHPAEHLFDSLTDG